VEAVRNLKIDKITVWDSGSNGKNATTTANFLSGFVKSLPPLHDIAEMAGLDLPRYLGQMGAKEETEDAPEKAGPTSPGSADKA
jgi:flotillin